MLLDLLQNNCLRRIIGGYKRYPRAALERETVIAPLNLYVKVTALQRAAKVANNPVKDNMKEQLIIYKSLSKGYSHIEEEKDRGV